MPVQKSQLQRLRRIAGALKENRYPNSETLVKEFERIALEEEIPIKCVKKTILRDMKVLENEFGCPLAFDRARNGYYLKYPWDFIAPADLGENEMLATVIGARIAEDIFPAPLRNKIRNAVDFLINNNCNSIDFLDTANIGSLSILSGLHVQMDPAVFLTVFEGWQNHHCVRITYADYKGDTTERLIEPHTLVFNNNSWYTKGFCRLKNEPRTFALHRIRTAERLKIPFTPSRAIIDSVNPDDFLGFQKIRDVKLKVTGTALDSLKAAPLHSQQVIHPDGMADIPAVTKEVLFPFVLSQQGQVELLEPAALRNELKATLAKMLEVY